LFVERATDEEPGSHASSFVPGTALHPLLSCRDGDGSGPATTREDCSHDVNSGFSMTGRRRFEDDDRANGCRPFQGRV